MSGPTDLPVVIPGIRVGQVWQLNGVSRGGSQGLAQVDQADATTVTVYRLNWQHVQTAAPPSTMLRSVFERKYRLIQDA